MPHPGSDALNWLNSARDNFERIRKRHSKSDPCRLIEHYTDVIAEATVAEAMASGPDADLPGIEQIRSQATKLTSTATRAQRGAVKACQLGVRSRR